MEESSPSILSWNETHLGPDRFPGDEASSFTSSLFSVNSARLSPDDNGLCLTLNASGMWWKPGLSACGEWTEKRFILFLRGGLTIFPFSIGRLDEDDDEDPFRTIFMYLHKLGAIFMKNCF